MDLTPDGLLSALTRARERVQLFSSFNERGRNTRLLPANITMTQFFGAVQIVTRVPEEFERQVLAWYFLEGASPSQIAERYECSEADAEEAIQHAIKTLVQSVRRES